MRERGVHLQYSFEALGQRGAEVQNPLFDLLDAVREHGSIGRAAQALGFSYRHVWGRLKHWEEVIGAPLVVWKPGTQATLTPFAERLLLAERRSRARLTPHIEALRAELERVLSDALDGSQQVLTMFASHDLALPQLRELSSSGQRLHVDLRFAGSMDCLRALNAGRCLVAGFHVPVLGDRESVFARSLKGLLQPGRHKLIGCMRRSQGLMVVRGNPRAILGIADLARPGLRFVNRQQGSGTRLLMDHLVAAQGVDAQAVPGYFGPPEDSHVAIAASVASGVADAGPGIEAAARQFGLDFVPLLTEEYFLVCLKPALDTPPVQRLLRTLESAPWRQALARLPGYAASRPGEVLSLTAALPWWRFRRPKALASAAGQSAVATAD